MDVRVIREENIQLCGCSFKTVTVQIYAHVVNLTLREKCVQLDAERSIKGVTGGFNRELTRELNRE